MAEQFIQRVPLLRLVKPFAFLAQDHLRNGLRQRRELQSRLHLLGRDLVVAVAVEDGVQAAFHRPLITFLGQGVKALALSFVKTADSTEKRRHFMSRRAVVENHLITFPRPRAEPRGDVDFFAHPAVEQVVVSVVQQSVQAIPVAGLAVLGRRHVDFSFGRQAIQQAFGD
ncbi:hypothetical protein D3C85_832340 [compost metagenome]